MSLNNEMEKELEMDLKKYLMEDCMFLSEDDIPSDKPEEKPSEVPAEGQPSEGHKEAKVHSKSEINKKAMIVNKKAKKLIEIMKDDNEEALLKAPNRISILTKAAVKYTACSLVLGGPIAGIIGYTVQKYLTAGIKNNKRRELKSTLEGDLAVINKKIEELDGLKKLTKEQKLQRYELLKMQKETENNIKKLQVFINHNAS